jgi:FkbM family methyltransferase
MKKILCSVGILTFNSAQTLPRALESVKTFDDIVINDGGSSDATLEIAKRYGARIISQDSAFKNANHTLRDWSGVRNQLLKEAKHDWFLYIDSDETCSDELREDIQSIVSEPLTPASPLVYRIPIGIYIEDRLIRYSSNFPGYQTRFFNRTSSAMYVKPVHERIVFDTAKVHVGTLVHPWFTYASRDEAGHYLRETKHYRALDVRAFEGRTIVDSVRYGILRSFVVSAAVVVRASRNYLFHGFKKSAPIEVEVGRACYPLIVAWGVLGVIMRRIAVLVREGCERSAPRVFRSRLFYEIAHPTVPALESKRIDPEMILAPLLFHDTTDEVFVDIGAHIGPYVAALYPFISHTRIVAFEPNPHSAKRLHALFPDITVERIALSSRSGEARFKVPLIRGTPYETRGTLASYTEDGESGTQLYDVATETLDAYCARTSATKIAVLKIDVEGHEAAVIEGAQTVLTAQRPVVIIEIEQRHHTEPIEKIFRQIEVLGYAGWFFDAATWGYVSIEKFAVAEHQRHTEVKTIRYIQNFVFAPKGTGLPTFPPRSSL